MSSKEPDVIGRVLTVLEGAAKTPIFESLNLSDVFGREKWAAFKASDLLRSSTSIVDSKSISIITTTAFEINNIISILRSLLRVASEFHEEHEKWLSLTIPKLSKGIQSLPDDILPIIFDFAVRGEGRFGGKQAVRLSHVSKRFRSIALRHSQLWSTLTVDVNRPVDRLTNAIARTGEVTPFNVFVEIDPDDYATTKKINSILLPTTPRWRSLSLREGIRVAQYDDRIGERAIVISDFFASFFGKPGSAICSVPSLEELHLEGHDAKEMITCKVPLRSPNLRFLRCSEIVPWPSEAFTFVTTFHLSTRMPRDLWSQRLALLLLKLLASLPNLEDLELELFHMFRLGKDEEWETPSPSHCPLLKSLRLSMPNIGILQGRQGFVASFFKNLRMPRLQALAIDVGFLAGGESDDDRVAALSVLSAALLTTDDTGTLAQPSTLKYDITYRPVTIKGSSTNAPPAEPRRAPVVFAIPLQMIPSVSTLTVTSSNRIVFTRENGIAANCCGEPTALSELAFIGCQNMEVEDLRLSILSLQSIGAWESIRRVVVEDCDGMDREEVLDMVGVDRLHYT